MARILGIESSCDDTGAAILNIDNGHINVCSNIVSSQFALHERYGGVVPELATRAHLQNILPVVEEALAQANMKGPDLDAIAVTQGPGIMGALLVGVQVAKALAYSWNVDFIGVNHLEGHIASIFLDAPTPITFPFVALLVSGGHSCLYRVESHTDIHLLGATHDDAAGEAFEKAAKMMGLPYPGGVKIDKLAQTGSTDAFPFPRPMLHKGLDFSFSGLKSAFRRTLEEQGYKAGEDSPILNDLCASFQEAVVEVLCTKAIRALKQEECSTLAIMGGVAANSRLRGKLQEWGQQEGVQVHIPNKAYCTDNAAMIACAGYQRWVQGERSEFSLSASTRMPLRGLRGGSNRRVSTKG